MLMIISTWKVTWNKDRQWYGPIRVPDDKLLEFLHVLHFNGLLHLECELESDEPVIRQMEDTER